MTIFTQNKNPTQVLGNSEITAFDVDETLLIFKYPPELEPLAIEINSGVKVVPHYKHIQQMAEHYARGHQILIWSAGGWEWAAQVVDILDLHKYEPLVMKKISWYYDDKPVQEFMPEINRVYYPIESIRAAYERQKETS